MTKKQLIEELAKEMYRRYYYPHRCLKWEEVHVLLQDEYRGKAKEFMYCYNRVNKKHGFDICWKQHR